MTFVDTLIGLIAFILVGVGIQSAMGVEPMPVSEWLPDLFSVLP